MNTSKTHATRRPSAHPLLITWRLKAEPKCVNHTSYVVETEGAPQRSAVENDLDSTPGSSQVIILEYSFAFAPLPSTRTPGKEDGLVCPTASNSGVERER